VLVLALAGPDFLVFSASTVYVETAVTSTLYEIVADVVAAGNDCSRRQPVRRMHPDAAPLAHICADAVVRPDARAHRRQQRAGHQRSNQRRLHERRPLALSALG